MSAKTLSFINWSEVMFRLRTEALKNQVKALRRDAYRFLDAWEAWTNEHDCVLQANDGCDQCNLEDFDLDWCPFHKSAHLTFRSSEL